MSIADMIAKFEEWNNTANETVHNVVETANKALSLIQKLPLPGLQALIEIVKAVLKGIEQVVKYLHDLVDFIIQDLKSAQKLDDTGNDLTQRVAVPVAGVSKGFLSQLEGRKERFWEGAGAKAYTEHTDLQGQACEELSNAYQTLATALHDAYDGCMVFAGAMAVAAGTFIAGVVTAVLVALLAQNRRLKEDSVIGVLFVGAFALGVAIIARAPGYAGSLQDFLFGSITGIPASDVPVVLAGAAFVLLMLFLAHRPIVAVTLDRESARAAGVHVLLADLSLYVAVALAVVISVQTIGNVLVLALLVTPAATARLLCDRLGTMMILSPVLGASGGLVGLYLSWALDVPTGATIVLVLTACFVLAWVFAPRHGLLARSLRERRG